MLTKWNRVQPPRTSNLYLIPPEGQPKFITDDVNIDFAIALPSKLLWQPDQGGIPHFNRVDGKDSNNLQIPDSMKAKSGSLQTLGLEFLNANGRQLIVPFQDTIAQSLLMASKASPDDLVKAEASGTMVLSSDLDQRIRYLPGFMYGESPDDDAYVGLSVQKSDQSFQLIYCSRSTGRTMRKITVPTNGTFQLITQRSRPTLNFVPGHELTVAASSVAGELHLIRSGPLLIKSETSATTAP